MTDRQFLARFHKAIVLMQDNKSLKWVASYLPKASLLADQLDTAIPVVEHAEAQWHKDAGSKIVIVEQAETEYRHWANHVKADVHGAELGEFVVDHNSVAGLEEGLGKMLDAFGHHAGNKVADDPIAAYAKEAIKKLQPMSDGLGELLVSTRDSWQVFRDAAAQKNAVKLQANEIFKSVRRHLKVDLGDTAAVRELATPPRHTKQPSTQPQPKPPTP
jgi:hypothetical protein